MIITVNHSLIGSGNDKKSPDHSGLHAMDRKKSPPSHWYNGVAEDGHDNRSRHRRYTS